MPVLDHLVYATPDLNATVEYLAARLGVAPAAGGQHPGMGTRNHLYGIGNGAYLEIIGPDESQDVSPQWFGIALLTAPRLVGWAVRTEKIAHVVSGARERGYDPGDPVAMSRAGDDGSLLTWMLTPPPSEPLMPFLIDWGETPHPTTRGLPEVTLVSFAGKHPHPIVFRETLGTLGVPLAMTRADSPALTAVIEGPGGRATLR